MSSLPFSVSGHMYPVASALSYELNAPTEVINVNPSSNALKFVNVHYFVIQGQLADGHYEFPLTLTSPAGIHGEAEGQVVAYSVASHTELVAIGETSKPAMSPLSYCHGDASTQLHVHFQDVVGLDLADVYQPIAWSYNCVSITSFDASGDYETWTPDGWSEPYVNRTAGYTDSSHQTVFSSTNAQFKNTFFCLGATVYMYDHSSSYGSSTGGRTASVSTSFSWSCAPLYSSWWWDY